MYNASYDNIGDIPPGYFTPPRMFALDRRSQFFFISHCVTAGGGVHPPRHRSRPDARRRGNEQSGEHSDGRRSVVSSHQSAALTYTHGPLLSRHRPTRHTSNVSFAAAVVAFTSVVLPSLELPNR